METVSATSKVWTRESAPAEKRNVWTAYVEPTLHYAIVVWTTLIAKGESPESDTKDATELQRIIGDIPQDYGSPDLGQVVGFSPDVSDARGNVGTLATSNGVDRR